MAALLYKRSVLAMAASQLFPPSIRESLISDPVFRNIYGLTADARISFGEAGVSVQRSQLFDGIRELLADCSALRTLKDDAGEEWRLELVEEDNERRLVLSHGERRVPLPSFSALSPDQAERLKGFDRDATQVNLSEETTRVWREILGSRALSDDEIGELHTEIEETPIWVAAAIRSDIKAREGSLWSTLVPRSERYFDRLVGECKTSQNVAEYARMGAKDHIRQVMSWRASDGFLLSSLLASHSSLSAAIDADHLEDRDLLQAYEWLQTEGDRISQIGAIEIGLSILDKRPGIEPYLRAIIEQVRDDSADNLSQFHLLSALIMLVEGELARTKILRGKPVFWRRLASIAQASLLERCMKSRVDIANFSEWARKARGQLFYLQTITDLRREPRWLPEYVFPRQLKAEFIGRIITAAKQNAAKIHTPAMRELLYGEDPESIKSLVEFPFAYLPGPLEGGLESQVEAPAEVLRAIEEQLSADVLRPHSFTALVNSALIYRLDADQAQLAAKALRAAKHQLRQADSEEQLYSVLSGLATVAAVTRSGELAEELRTLTRRWMHETGRGLSAEEAMRIGLVAAAAHSDLTAWCMFLGEWITELAFQSLHRDEMERLHSSVERLCHIVPELWRTCGKAEAALNVAVRS